MRRAVTLIAGGALALGAGFATAQEAASPAEATDHSAMGHGDAAPAAMAAYMKAMDDMMAAMAGMESTGDADVDFLLMMIPHHQSAVDMSVALLSEVKDAEVKALGEAVIATQEAEIAAMRAMLARLGHPVE